MKLCEHSNFLCKICIDDTKEMSKGVQVWSAKGKPWVFGL